MRTPQTKLANIKRWLPLLTEQQATYISATPINGTAPSYNQDALPFSLHTRIDFDDEGASGAHTTIGILDILTSWANHITADANQPSLPHPCDTLIKLWPWITTHWNQDDIDCLTDDIITIHTYIAQLTGHAPIHVGTCPRCHNNVYTFPQDNGIPDYIECFQCLTTWTNTLALKDAQLAEAYRQSEQLFLPIDEILRLAKILNHPGINANLLRQWTQRGHITTIKDTNHHHNLYNAHDIFA